MPSKPASRPMGICISTASQSSFSRNWRSTLSGSAAGAVHLVDEGQPRNAVAPHLAVNGDRLGLYAADRAEHEDRPVQNAETAFDLHGEIHVARGVDEVDRRLVPLRPRWRRW